MRAPVTAADKEQLKFLILKAVNYLLLYPPKKPGCKGLLSFTARLFSADYFNCRPRYRRSLGLSTIYFPPRSVLYLQHREASFELWNCGAVRRQANVLRRLSFSLLLQHRAEYIILCFARGEKLSDLVCLFVYRNGLKAHRQRV